MSSPLQRRRSDPGGDCGTPADIIRATMTARLSAIPWTWTRQSRSLDGPRRAGGAALVLCAEFLEGRHREAAASWSTAPERSDARDGLGGVTTPPGARTSPSPVAGPPAAHPPAPRHHWRWPSGRSRRPDAARPPTSSTARPPPRPATGSPRAVVELPEPVTQLRDPLRASPARRGQHVRGGLGRVAGGLGGDPDLVEQVVRGPERQRTTAAEGEGGGGGGRGEGEGGGAGGEGGEEGGRVGGERGGGGEEGGLRAAGREGGGGGKGEGQGGMRGGEPSRAEDREARAERVGEVLRGQAGTVLDGGAGLPAGELPLTTRVAERFGVAPPRRSRRRWSRAAATSRGGGRRGGGGTEGAGGGGEGAGGGGAGATGDGAGRQRAGARCSTRSGSSPSPSARVARPPFGRRRARARGGGGGR